MYLLSNALLIAVVLLVLRVSAMALRTTDHHEKGTGGVRTTYNNDDNWGKCTRWWESNVSNGTTTMPMTKESTQSDGSDSSEVSNGSKENKKGTGRARMPLTTIWLRKAYKAMGGRPFFVCLYTTSLGLLLKSSPFFSLFKLTYRLSILTRM